MNAITIINVALHALLLSALGWALVRWCVKDARHRAWASLLALTVVVLAPVLMEWETPIRQAATTQEQSASTAPASSWRPDWKVPADAVSSVRFSQMTSNPSESAPAPAYFWSLQKMATWFCAIWITGSILLALRHAAFSLAARRWRLSLRTLTPEEESTIPSSVRGHSLRVAADSSGPCVVGLWNPVIVIPRQIISRWTHRQWQWLVRHEGEHVRGRDTLIAWLLGWVRAALWWNPFVHRLVEEWSQAREEVCDHAAVSTAEEATAYTRFLIDIATNSRAHSSALLHMAASRPARRLRARTVAMLAMRRVRGSVSLLFALGSVLILLSAAALVSCVGVQAADPPPQASGEMHTRAFKVPPYLLPPGLTAIDLLTTLGIPFPEGATAVFNSATSQLIVKNTVANLERVENEFQVLKGAQAVQSTQIYITTKWVQIRTSPSSVPDPFPLETVGKFDGKDTTILTDPEFQVVIRALSQKKGVDLMTSPSVTTKPGQRAVVEVVREFNGSEFVAGSSQDKSAAPMDFIGVRNELLVTFEGSTLELECQADLGEVDKMPGWAAKPGEKLPEGAEIVHLRKSKTLTIEDGNTVAVEMARSHGAPARQVILFITANLIDPTGSPRDPGAVARARAVTALLEKARAIQEKGNAALKEGLKLAAEQQNAAALKRLQEAFKTLSVARQTHPSLDLTDIETRLRATEEALEKLGHKVRRNAPAAPKQPQIPITIEVKTVDVTHKDDTDFLRLLMEDAPVQPVSPPDLSKLPPADQQNLLTPAEIPPGLFTVAGVFTPAQFAKLIQGIGRHQEAKVTSYPVVNGMNGKPATIPEQAKEPRDLTVKIEPVVGPEGYTIDLSIQITDHRFEVLRQTSVTTAITLWNGQTVALGGLVRKDEKGSLSRLVFITVKMADPKETKPAKTSKPSQ